MGKRKTIRGVDPKEHDYGHKDKHTPADIIQRISIDDINKFFVKKWKTGDTCPYVLFQQFVKDEVEKAGLVKYEDLNIYRIRISPDTGTALNELQLKWLLKDRYSKWCSDRRFQNQYGMWHLQYGPSILWTDWAEDNVIYILEDVQ